MTKKAHEEPAEEPTGTDLETKLKECADKCGFTEADARALMSGGPHKAGAEKAGELGDGALLAKFFTFMQMAAPFILALFGKKT